MTEAVTAKHPGMCAHCGRQIYVGDKIAVIEDMEKQSKPTIAYHWLCWCNQEDWE